MSNFTATNNSPYPNNTFQNQQHLAKRYTKIGIIGRGTFGTVYRGIDNEDEHKREVAIKVMDLESIEDDINNIMQEIIALRDCQSEHVPKYYHSFNIGPELWIVMEYMGGGSVHDYLDPKEQLGLESENLIAIILREVTKGLAYLHSLKMIHRDIKAANILLSDNGNVKLADFGVVGRLTETIEKRMTMIGSPYWMAPEVIVPEKGKDDGYGTQADIWSLGILGMEMANGIPPHGDQHPFEAMRRIMEGPPPQLVDNGEEWSENFKAFLLKCLEKDPKKRPSANELLKHAFFKDCGELSELKTELIDAMKEYDTYDGDIDYYDENDQKYGSVVYSDATGTSNTVQDNMGTLNIINDGDAVTAALTNDVASGIGSDDTLEYLDNTNPNSNGNTNPNSPQRSVSPRQSQIQLQQQLQQQQGHSSNTSINLNNNNSNLGTKQSTGGKLKQTQYSQSSRHILVSGSSVGAAIGGPRHIRQFSKRKSTAQAAAIRAHRKLSKQKSYNMSIEWTPSARASLNMLRVPIRPEDLPPQVDLYDDNKNNNNNNEKNLNHQVKSKSIGATTGIAPQTSTVDEVVSEKSDDFKFVGGTMVRSGVATYDIGIQTDWATKYDKSVQTDTHTVAHLVGIRKDIISICDNLEMELSAKGKEHLTELKNKIREMTHLKITERRMKSINIEDAQEAQRRKNEMRAQSQVLNNSDLQSTQERLKDLRAKMDARTKSNHKI